MKKLALVGSLLGLSCLVACAPPQFRLSTSPGGTVSGGPINCDQASVCAVAYPSQIETWDLLASPLAGNRFSHWVGCLGETSLTCSQTIGPNSQSKTLSAFFIPDFVGLTGAVTEPLAASQAGRVRNALELVDNVYVYGFGLFSNEELNYTADPYVDPQDPNAPTEVVTSLNVTCENGGTIVGATAANPPAEANLMSMDIAYSNCRVKDRVYDGNAFMWIAGELDVLSLLTNGVEGIQVIYDGLTVTVDGQPGSHTLAGRLNLATEANNASVVQLTQFSVSSSASGSATVLPSARFEHFLSYNLNALQVRFAMESRYGTAVIDGGLFGFSKIDVADDRAFILIGAASRADARSTDDVNLTVLVDADNSGDYEATVNNTIASLTP